MRAYKNKCESTAFKLAYLVRKRERERERERERNGNKLFVA